MAFERLGLYSAVTSMKTQVENLHYAPTSAARTDNDDTNASRKNIKIIFLKKGNQITALLGKSGIKNYERSMSNQIGRAKNNNLKWFVGSISAWFNLN